MMAPDSRAAKVARLVDSPNTGEAVAALEALRRMLPKGESIADIINRGWQDQPERELDKRPPEPVGSLYPWQQKARWALLAPVGTYTERELQFLRDMRALRLHPTVAQETWLLRLQKRGRTSA